MRVRLLKQVTLTVTGAVSGRVYHFAGPGAEVDVDERDVPALLQKTRVSCCSGLPASPYFEIVR